MARRKYTADKLIDSVCFNARHTHIDYVQCRVDSGDAVSSNTERLARRDVISQIRNGTSFCTIFQNNGKWSRGAIVEIINIGGEEFLKTVRDGIKKDNLDNLPEFQSPYSSSLYR